VFKSYYVVWKHLSAPIFSVSIFEFKSYYVVWKHIISVFGRNMFLSLNRTM